ncbi:MAG: fatty-acid--CoA ligase [Caulobacter sp.]|nr:fatty-acid--CoA ligase [Caulobacter sp.]
MQTQTFGYVDAISRAREDRPDAPSLIFGDRISTWAQTLDHAGRIAGALRALGVKADDRVAVLSANSDRYVELYLAIPWAGAVIVPLNSRWAAEENRLAIADCEPTVIILGEGVDPASLAVIESFGLPIVSMTDDAPEGWTPWAALLAAKPIPDAGRRGTDLFGIFYTGGTTGRSKGVMLSHGGVVSNGMGLRETGLFPEGCTGLIIPPLFHLAAGGMTTATLLGGGAVIIQAAFDPETCLAAIETEGVTDILLVPTMIQMLLDAPTFAAHRLTGLQRIAYGASSIAESTLDRMIEAAPHVRFTQAYGMTEVSCAATLLAPEHHLGQHRAAGRHRSAGRAFSFAELKIAGPEGETLPAGEVGEVLIRGAGVMLGYWRQPDLTAEALAGGWMHTGDGGRMDEEGFVYIVDRIKDMIITGGENVYSAEVESVLAQHPDIAQCAVIAAPDLRWGERVHADIVVRPGASLTEDEVMTHCRASLAGYKCPRSMSFWTTPLPVSAVGKIAKNVLRERFKAA